MNFVALVFNVEQMKNSKLVSVGLVTWYGIEYEFTIPHNSQLRYEIENSEYYTYYHTFNVSSTGELTLVRD